jgi:hypothetical protein
MHVRGCASCAVVLPALRGWWFYAETPFLTHGDTCIAKEHVYLVMTISSTTAPVMLFT